jgi:hypothetical protein
LNAQMWVECSFEIEGQRVGARVRRLGDDERGRMAAEIAWFADGLLTPGVELDGTAWPSLLDEILTRHVTVTLDADRSEDAVGFWRQVVCLTFEAFVKANELYPTRRGRLGARAMPRH